MKNLIIGIIPTIKLFETDNPYIDRYEFVNNYVKKVYESGAIPIGLLLNDGIVSLEQLKICDAFIFPGGNIVNKEIYQILNYAYLNKKPVLGICLGMQAMVIYSVLKDECSNNNVDYQDSALRNEIYQKIKENNPILGQLEEDNIHYHIIRRDNIDTAYHEVLIKENTYLSEAYQSTKKNVISLHRFVVLRTGKMFKVSALALDNTIEAIESVDKGLFWVGVQYHPEIDDKDILIKYFIDKLKG